ncbi:MAG: M20/M25/M40 family metallo-hydrolase [Nitrospinaceae bacterium]|nr:M20/M25/M40 family metallo-hydrolase [Nitrospinaceae bacterium]NIR56841.1 M20/M25/M40 family metallo-hydrolase [Nitrospinaceae bacterium]NIS87308.1 M20/M25/M40 family metallo-hydrolase [Nitrospinaceae bacterium]NIT84161.1 M20/M25/M40 family metallo-hydrolase [Nitrospinaceae bacterium]NIU46348.1 M20/M25/M40 family metallo-hydrolase [Nitrospinaceae bacterium]
MTSPESEIIRQHLEALIGERNPYSTPGPLEQAGAYITQQLQSLGLAVSREEVPFDGMISHNIFGFKEGTDPAAGTFILGAHYDSVEGTPGADDNASAVAALLEVARCLADTPVAGSIMFTAFTLEEYGFIGSRQMAVRLKENGDPISGMISLEMLGFRNREPGSQTYPPYVDPNQYPDTGDFIAVVGNQPSQSLTMGLAQTLKTAAPELGVEHLVLPGRGDDFVEVRLSDHCPFWEHGFKAAMLTDTAFFRNPHYHQPTDTLETLDIEFIRDICVGLSAYLQSPVT